MNQGFYATDKILKKRYLDTGVNGHSDLSIALTKFKELGGIPIEKVSIFAVDVDSRKILGKLGSIKEFMEKDRIDWKMISKFELSKGSYLKYRDKLDWTTVSSIATLSQDLIEFNQDLIDFSKIKINFDRFTDDFILNHPAIDLKNVITDKKLSTKLFNNLDDLQKDYYVSKGRITLEHFDNLLNNAVFKKELYRLVSLNHFADKCIFIKYAEHIDWLSVADIFKEYPLTKEVFWKIYPFAKGCSVLEVADLERVYTQLFKKPLNDFDYEQFLLNNHLDAKTLNKAIPCLKKCIEPNKLDLILSIS